MRNKLLFLSVLGLVCTLSANAQIHYRKLTSFNATGDTSACVKLTAKPVSQLCDMIEKEIDIEKNGGIYFIYYQGDSTLAFIRYAMPKRSDPTTLDKPIDAAYYLDESNNLVYLEKVVKQVNNQPRVLWRSEI